MARRDKNALAFLLLGGVLLGASQGRWVAPALLWLAPVLLVRGMRTGSVRWVFPGFVVAHTGALELAFMGTMPLPPLAALGLFTGLSVVLALVFLADRYVAARIPGILGTLALPTGWVSYDLAQAVLSPAGSWGSVAYGLTEHSGLLQLTSVTGWTGLTFLLGWTATIVNQVWERGPAEPGSRRAVTTWGAVMLLVLGGGYLRLATSDAGRTVRAAAVVAPGTFDRNLDEVWYYTRGIEVDDEVARIARRRISESQDEHFDLIERELMAGARIAVWAEANASMTEAEEAEWVARGQALAREHGAYIGLGLTVFRPDYERPDARRPTKNEFILIDPAGDVAWTFYKATRVFGTQHLIGDGTLPTVDGELGRLTAAICFDLDFPRLLRQAGVADADIMIAPSNDWEEVRGLHARMARVRAVEQGFALLRPTKDGISLATDAWGRVVGSLDTFSTDDKVLVAQVPTSGTRTLYSRLGDTFSWLSAAAFVGLVGRVSRRRT